MNARIEARAMATVRDDEGRRYVCVAVGGELLVVPDACKHRGGPLSLGTVCPRTGAITCPWHELVNGPRELRARALPHERVGDTLHFEPPPLPATPPAAAPAPATAHDPAR